MGGEREEYCQPFSMWCGGCLHQACLRMSRHYIHTFLCTDTSLCLMCRHSNRVIMRSAAYILHLHSQEYNKFEPNLLRCFRSSVDRALALKADGCELKSLSKGLLSLGPRPKPTPVRITSSIRVHDTGSDPHWGWFGSGTETKVYLVG